MTIRSFFSLLNSAALLVTTGFTLSGAAAAETASAPIPFSELGAKATADYHGDALGITATAEGAELRTGFQRLFAQATREGLWLDSTVDKGGRLRLVASAIGRSGRAGSNSVPPSISLIATGSVVVGEKVVAFTRPGLTEEYSVSVDGVRQDFVIAERPAGVGDLRVELALTGARAEATAYGAKLTLDGSRRELAYSRLRVVDATGRELIAQLAVLSSNLLAVSVADDSAAYPVRIDPTFSDADWVSINSGISGANGLVLAAVVDGTGALYIGGDFTFVGTAFANHIAKWNGTSWSALGEGVNNFVFTLAVNASGSELYVGGEFTVAGTVPANHIAKWNGASWSALDEGVNSRVYALALNASGSELYVGGNFTTAGTVPANHIAKWNGTSWSALDEGVNGIVYALALNASGRELYVGGGFTVAGTVSANHIAKWNGTSWSALDEGVNSRVSALAWNASGSELYVGGEFTTAGSVPANRIAKWNGTSWSALDEGLNAFVYALAWNASGNELYVGGEFTTAGTVPANRIAKWNGTSWSALDEGVNSRVYALAWNASGNELYVGGEFTTAGTVPANRIAKWNGASWSALDEGLNTFVYALALNASGNELYVGGNFTTAGTVPANHIAKWNGTSWSALGSGTDRFVLTLATDTANHLFVGGYFFSAGTKVSPFIAQANLVPPTPEIIVERPVGTSLMSGTASIHFGSVNEGESADVVFTVKNTGDADLTGLGVTIDGPDAARFALTSIPTAPVSGPSGSTTFSVRFSPGTVGARAAVLHIASNDADENPFDIALTGTGIGPEIVVQGNSMEIFTGDTTPSPTDHTDFGESVAAGGPVSRIFTLLNSGTAPLIVSAINRSGPNAALFAVSGLGFPATITPTENRTFTVTFTPTVPGTFGTVVSVANNDSDENPYVFTIQATRLNSPPVAQDDYFTVLADAPVAIPVSALLANDSDPDGSALILVEVSPLSSPGHPDVALSPDGSTLTVTAPSDDVTEATFTYRVSDGAIEATATVHLRIQPVPLVYEGFNYPAGSHLAIPELTHTEPEKNGGLGWAGPWTTIKSFLVFPIDSTSLVPPVAGFPSSGGAAVDAGTASRQIRPIRIEIGQKLWFSAVLRSAAQNVGDVIMEFEFDDIGMRLGTYTPGLGPMGWGLTAYNTSSGGPALPDVPALLVAEMERTTVSHYNFRLYLNPPSGSTPPAPIAQHGDDRFVSWETLRSVIITDGYEVERAGFDEIRIGRSYASVTSSDPRLIASLNEIRVVNTGVAGGFSLHFGAPGPSTYVLQRKLLTCGGPEGTWEDLTSQATGAAGLLTFVDAVGPCGAMYRVARTGP